MSANAAVYMPTTAPKLGPEMARSESPGPSGAVHYEGSVGGIHVRLNVMPAGDLETHLARFCGWVGALQDPDDAKVRAKRRIAETKCVLGLVTSAEFAASPALWPWLIRIARANSGVVFAWDSVYDGDGGVIVGAMRLKS